MKSLLFILFSSAAFACTGIKLQSQDGSIVHGRTAEFGVDLDLSLLYVPRGYEFTATTPNGPGLRYQSKYAALGVIAFNAPAIMDGMNEKGLCVGVFYFPHYASYAKATSQNQNRALSPLDFSNWILTQFSTIDELKSALNSVTIAPTIFPNWGPASPPFHYIVYDREGNSLVIEPMDGKLQIHDNQLGIITNSPTFDWHMTNLNNFVQLTPFNTEPKTIDGLTFVPFGQGSGMLGLPGDFSPPSRFVRAAIYSVTAIPAPTSAESVLQAFHILNQFDIPVGVIREKANGVVHTDRTLATCVRDPQSLRYYLRTYENQSIKMVDLKTFDPTSKQLKRLSLSGPQPIHNVSSDFR